MNRTILSALAGISNVTGVNGIFYALNRNRKRTITFHNVLPDALFVRNIANGVSCSESDFRKIVRELKRTWRFSTDLFDLKTITITFDDGYLSQYEIAARILHEEGNIPAILFISGDVMDGKVLLVDKLVHWTAGVPTGIMHQFGCSSSSELWLKVVKPKFHADALSKGMSLYKELDGIYPFEKIFQALGDEYKRLRLGGITRVQLDELRSRGWKIGWHTQSHYPLSRLSDAEKRNELMAPEDMRHEVLGFPYGENESVDVAAIKIAENLGYPCAVSNTMEPNSPFCRYFMPRMSLPADRRLLHFALSGSKHFLKFCSRLPTVY